MLMFLMWLFIPALIMFVSANFTPLLFMFGIAGPSYGNSIIYDGFFEEMEDRIRNKKEDENEQKPA